MFRFSLLLMSTLMLWALGAYAGPNQPPTTDQFSDALPDGAIARLGTLRFRHDSTIVFAAFLPDGKRVLSVGKDGVASIWEFPSGKSICRLETLAGLPAEAVTSVTLSPNGKRLTTFGSDGFMRVWDLEAAKELGKVPMVADAPAGSDVYGPIGGGGGGFSKGGGKGPSSREAPVAKRAVYSHDAKTLMAGSSRVLQFVNLETGKEVGPSHGHTQGLTSIWFTSDGKIATKDNQSTRTWTSAGKELAAVTFKLPAGALMAASVSPFSRANPVAFSPDGRYVATSLMLSAKKGGGNLKREAVVYDTADGKEVCRIALEADDNMMFARFSGRPMAFSPDSKVLAMNVDEPNNAKEKIQCYAVPSGKLLRTLEAGPVMAQAGTPSTLYGQKMLFSGDGKALAFQAGRGEPIVVIDALTGRLTASIPALEPTQVLMGGFSPDGRCLALEKGNGTVTICELATGKARLTYGQPLGKMLAGDLLDDFIPASLALAAIKSRANPAISPDGKLLAMCGMDGTIHIWDVIGGKELKVFKGHTRFVNALAFAPNGKTLASASGDTTALIWDVTKISRPMLPVKALKPGDFKAWWQALADNDAAKAFAAMRDFEAVPQDAIAWIKDHLKPAAPLDMKRFEDLRQKLDNGSFKIRNAATEELLKIGERIVPAIDKAMAANPPLETLQRLTSLRTNLMSLVGPAEKLQALRAVEVLEHIATPQARTFSWRSPKARPMRH